MKFHISLDELTQMKEWDETHDKECPIILKAKDPSIAFGAIGGNRTYVFTPTSIGILFSYKCPCGAKLHLDRNF